jgi:hypothetical protein
MTVAARRTPQERISREERLQLPNTAHFECQQQPRRLYYTISSPLHVKTFPPAGACPSSYFLFLTRRKRAKAYTLFLNGDGQYYSPWRVSIAV